MYLPIKLTVPTFPKKSMRLLVGSAVFFLISAACSAWHEQDDRVTAINASYSTRCAEEDNVYLKLVGGGIRKLRIEAMHPVYLKSLKSGESAADFSGCSFTEKSNSQDQVFFSVPKQVVLWESNDLLIVGNTLERFWRPNAVEIYINGVGHKNIHLIQVYSKDLRQPNGTANQFLVLYPPDGYWRLKPLAAPYLDTGGYGTSFLVGPIDEALRPVVDLTKVEFIPANRTFELDYRDGSHGSMKIVEINRQHAVLDYTHDRPSLAGQPLAAMRSMYVAPDNADASQVTYQSREGGALIEEPLMEFDRADVQSIRLGRSVPSKHNASAPDMWFGHFRRE
ncbi:hypothetical protein [Pseudomonas sp. R1-7]|uniref:hypothetical protein n=1 Tax=Pseudomonas sp. R1-7 TaxID=2817398 RepID=UPI003DA8608C